MGITKYIDSDYYNDALKQSIDDSGTSINLILLAYSDNFQLFSFIIENYYNENYTDIINYALHRKDKNFIDYLFSVKNIDTLHFSSATVACHLKDYQMVSDNIIYAIKQYFAIPDQRVIIRNISCVDLHYGFLEKLIYFFGDIIDQETYRWILFGKSFRISKEILQSFFKNTSICSDIETMNLLVDKIIVNLLPEYLKLLFEYYQGEIVLETSLDKYLERIPSDVESLSMFEEILDILSNHGIILKREKRKYSIIDILYRINEKYS